MKTEFKIIFGDSVLGNWYIKLITSEKKSVEQIKSLINNYTVALSDSVEEYSPCDIMDDLCEDHPGWRWEDWDTQEDVYVPGWEWMN